MEQEKMKILWLSLFFLCFTVFGSNVKFPPPQNYFKSEEESSRYLSKMKELHQLRANKIGITLDWNDPIFLEGKINPYLFNGKTLLPERVVDQMLEDLRNEKSRSRNHRNREKRSITNDRNMLWNDWNQTIYIRISPGLENFRRSVIINATGFWSTQTCISIVEHQSLKEEEPGIYFVESATGCFASAFGKANKRETISIDPECSDFASITRWIAHSLGVYQEHNRPDRDSYVTVNKNNVPIIYYYFYFYKQQWKFVNDYVVDYDYGSNMHFGGFEYSLNGSRVMQPTDKEYRGSIGQIEGPTFADVKRINRAYCSTTCNPWPNNCLNNGYLDPRLCITCKCPPPFTGPLCAHIRSGSDDGCPESSLVATNTFDTLGASGDRTCYFVVTAPVGRQVQFKMAYFGIESIGPIVMKGSCLYSYVELNWRADITNGGARYCDLYTPTTVNRTETNRLIVIYKGHPGALFELNYRSV